MSDPLIRENFIELLNKLGSERDEDVYRLAEDSGRYTVEIVANGHATKIVEAELGESVYLGEIRL